MSDCHRKRRAVAAAIKKNLPGSSGWVLMEFRGKTPFSLPSRTTTLVYDFEPGKQLYVDAFDVPMLTLWREDDEQVFFEVSEK